ncbi:MAG: hypothetical protein A2620_03255 [Acidobacteria bacterium RIFCSPHIGHO2_01_FULL_67_28]|nr:MAG: hypothetical protein A2620_03255 [Acidobacteria bacterium RIFCSPHIGHO2_01_FULL_67_28]
MTVILVLATLLAFIALDYFLSRRKAAQPVVVRPVGAIPAEPQPVYVEGFMVPDNLRYHPGHAWLLPERKHLVRIGLDEFAGVLAGPIAKIELPKPGRWLRQGQKAWTLYRDGAKTEMVSPIEGEVVEVNSALAQNPSLLRQDPYGRGWLMTVFVPDEESTARNLLPQGLVRNWMREAVERLYARQPQLAGAVAADGGRPTPDVFAGLPDASWEAVTREFFLS